jgi:hypothetical protein
VSGIDPRGAGLASRCVQVVPRDLVLVGGILAGEDGLASIHELAEGVVVVTTEARADELDAALADLEAAGLLRVVP